MDFGDHMYFGGPCGEQVGSGDPMGAGDPKGSGDPMASSNHIPLTAPSIPAATRAQKDPCTFVATWPPAAPTTPWTLAVLRLRPSWASGDRRDRSWDIRQARARALLAPGRARARGKLSTEVMGWRPGGANVRPAADASTNGVRRGARGRRTRWH